MQIGFRKKIVLDPNRSILKQIGKVQRGQWVFISGMNARILNIVGRIVVMLRFDRRTGKSEVLQYVG